MAAEALGLVGLWRGGERLPVLDPADRGLAYGDGLFETLRACHGQLPWWPRHRARLAAGAARLGLPLPDEAVLEQALAEGLARAPEGVIKLVLTRGSGGRGYLPPATPQPLLACFTTPLPAPSAAPLVVDVLGLRLARQPALAGIKHLNRLEQVLGAQEAACRGLDEGLMADEAGQLVCATRGNVFVCLDGAWRTPPVDRAGVAGIARGLLLERWPALVEAPLTLADLARAEALFLANAVRGILPVGRCGGRVLSSESPGLAEARAVLAASHPGFSGS